MKFRDKKTGKIFDTIEAARIEHCSKIHSEYRVSKCRSCLISADNNSANEECTTFIRNHAKTAVELMGLEIIQENTAIVEKPTRQSILDNAKRCVCGDRDQQYGSPENSFAAIAGLWGEYLWHKYTLGKPENAVGINFITPEDVAAMMVLFKCARIATGQNKADNWVDIAGYAACGGEIGGSK